MVSYTFSQSFLIMLWRRKIKALYSLSFQVIHDFSKIFSLEKVESTKNKAKTKTKENKKRN